MFCLTYLRGKFPLPFSRDHRTAIGKMQRAALQGGQFGNAMPRGSGKTTLCEAAGVWALLYGHRRFVVLLGATETAAVEMLASIKTELETNDLLLADFPEVCYPVRALDGINNRAAGQTLDGVRTRISWTDDRARLPTVKSSAASGGILRVAGITGRVRGMKESTAGGESVRPDLAIVDDPQTDDSASSPSQTAKRERILNGAVLGLAGPKRKIACFAAVTIIAPGDLADRILDRDRYPVWQGERSRMVVSFPKRMDLWDRYADIRRESLRAGQRGEAATAFYAANRAAMDEGAEVSWPERFDADELSGIQHAMNLLADRGEAAFAAEFQNDPIQLLAAGQIIDLSADEVAAKVNRAPRGWVPPFCTRLTAFIDVGDHVLWYAVVGWADDFTGAVVDYGTCPRQTRSYFAAADARPTLADQFKGQSLDVTARIYAGLRATVTAVVGRPYPRQGGGEQRVGICMIDTGHKPDTVYSFCRESPFAALLMPGRGWGVTARQRPMGLWAARPGETMGWNWRKTPTTGSGRGLHVLYDTNFYKTFVAERLLTQMGGRGSLALFGESPRDHQLFADHLTSEFRCRTAGQGRELDEWEVKPGRPDNHWWDCVVGCAVGASVLGAKWSEAGALGESPAPRPGRQKITLSELRKQRVAEREGRRR